MKFTDIKKFTKTPTYRINVDLQYLDRTIKPLLDRLLKKFISEYTGYKITEVAKFEPFRKTIDKLFGTGTLTLEEKVVSLLL